MSTYSLSGSGIQVISARTTAIYVDITTLPAGLTSGRANPTNHFDIGLLRFSDGTGYLPAVPITGGPDWFGVPVGTTKIAYSMLNGAVASVTEILNGPSTLPHVALIEQPGLMPTLISAASAECIGVEMTSNAVAIGSSAGWAANNLSCLLPLRVLSTLSITQGWLLNGAASTAHWDVGIYDDSLALLGHTGSQLQTPASLPQSAALSITLTPGRYWLAMAGDLTSLTTGTYSFGGSNRLRLVGVRAAVSNFPLATSPSLSAPAFGVVPVFGVSTYSP